MRTVKLSKAEIDVILALLWKNLCETSCYCGYKTDMCHKYKEDGTPRCKLNYLINSIRDKLSTQERR
jgi:hypothetical protein